MFTQLTLGVHVKDSEDYSLLSNESILFKKKKKVTTTSLSITIQTHYYYYYFFLLKLNVLVNIGTYNFFFLSLSEVHKTPQDKIIVV